MRFRQETYTGWGRALSATGQVARPERAHLVAGLVESAPEILPIGGLRSYGDTALLARGAGLRMERLDRILSFDDKAGVIEAEAGARLGDLLRAAAPKGWMPAVLPGTGFATLGGAIANDVHGKNHHRDGAFGGHLLSFELIGPEGEIETVTPESPLFKATLGGIGQTGVILSARLKLARIRAMQMDVRERRVLSLDAFLETFEEAEEPFQVGWIDALARGSNLGRGIFEAADFASEGGRADAGKRRAVPMNAPGFALSSPVVRAFNGLYFSRVPVSGRRRIRDLPSFFFPLDGISDWNRLYGKKGFHQFQCVVPMASARTGLAEMLKAVAETGIASPLAVIKKMGPGRSGYLSFPMEGMTLAVDFPNRAGTMPLLNRLCRMAAFHGGRVYLAKDSAVEAGVFAEMYDEIDDFRKEVARRDPEAKFLSRQAERLNVRGTA